MFIQITLCVLLILGFAWLLWMLSGALLTPVRSGRDTRITLVVQARGDAPELENLLRGALWLRESGTVAADILLVAWGSRGFRGDRRFGRRGGFRRVRRFWRRRRFR